MASADGRRRAAVRRRAVRRRRRQAARAFATFRRRVLPADGLSLVAVTALACLLAAGSAEFSSWMPLTSLVLPLILGGFLLSGRALVLLFAVVTALTLLVTVVRSQDGQLVVPPGVSLVLISTAVLVLLLNRSRRRLGVLGTRGDSMLVDLRERLRAHGEVPQLPRGWVADTALRSANGESFSGDFVVAARSADGHRLEVVLVDVSGKGLDAGTRALLLSGAFGGLLGAVAPDGFLPAANRYLLRQSWKEGFATAVHVSLELRTGHFCVTSAGHPPAARFDAGSGRWSTLDRPGGSLLGVVHEPGFPGTEGHLDVGDALLLYTDGLVEAPGRDLSEGIDRLLGQAERLVAARFHGGAARLVEATRTGESDDRALVLLRRI